MWEPRAVDGRGTGRARAQTRDRLLDAAEVCLERHGPAATTMGRVASIAGVSRGLVYKQIGTKDDLILGVLVRRAERFNERARAFIASQATIADALVEGILLAVNVADRDPYFGRLVASVTTDPARRIDGACQEAERLMVELWGPVLDEARRAGRIRADVVTRDAVLWIMYIEIALLSSRQALGVDERTQMRQLRTLFLPAILTPDGEAEVAPASSATGR